MIKPLAMAGLSGWAPCRPLSLVQESGSRFVRSTGNTGNFLTDAGDIALFSLFLQLDGA